MKYTFKEMLDDAKRAGLTSDKVMMRSVESMSELLCLVKEEHPELYWKFMREQHGIMYGNHYNEAFAMFDVGMMRYIDRDGKKCEGAHWTAEQIGKYPDDGISGWNYEMGQVCSVQCLLFRSLHSL